jgi:hypothetical protein
MDLLNTVITCGHAHANRNVEFETSYSRVPMFNEVSLYIGY